MLPYCSPSWLYQFTCPLRVQEGSFYSTSSPEIIVCRISVYHFFFIHSSVNEHLGCYLFIYFLILTVVNSAAVNIGVHASFEIILLSGFILRNGISGSYDNSHFNFLKSFHTVFHCGCTNLHPQQQCWSVLCYPHPLQHLLFVDILMVTIMTGVT